MFFQNLFNLFLGNGEVILILLQPCAIVLLDDIGPASIDLSGGILLFFQPLVAKDVAQMSRFHVITVTGYPSLR